MDEKLYQAMKAWAELVETCAAVPRNIALQMGGEVMVSTLERHGVRFSREREEQES